MSSTSISVPPGPMAASTKGLAVVSAAHGAGCEVIVRKSPVSPMSWKYS
ncbi:hypothetical protein FHR81_004821 [Actinoalloteichus hoggarensis]|nr:hypothetical protein [Actinoalloteichus hoggarensis]MBB5923748.1 hypothetical protein [Actinoalloteichus hoggarensis]